MNTTIATLASMVAMTAFGDFERERASVLLTSAEMSRVNHGVIEAYYPESLFWVHKKIAVDHGGGGWKKGAYFSLSEAAFSDTAIPALFTGTKDAFQFRIATKDLVAAVRGLPASAMIPTLEGTFLTDLDIASAKNLEKTYKKYIFLNAPTAMEGAPDPLKPEHLAIAQTSYVLEIGSREAIEKRVAELRKGVEGVPEAGKSLFSSHYESIPLSFEIVPTSPAGEEASERVGGAGSMVRGWYLVVSHAQDRAKVVLPVIQPEASKIKLANIRSSLEIPTKQIVRKRGTVSTFRMSLAEFIAQMVIPAIKPRAGTAAKYECIVDEQSLESTACRFGEVKDKDGAVTREWFVDVELPGERTEEDLLKRERNFLYLQEVGPKGEPKAFFRVAVNVDQKASSPKSAQVMPVTDRSKPTAESESLK
jgi:hypothetical protein